MPILPSGHMYTAVDYMAQNARRHARARFNATDFSNRTPRAQPGERGQSPGQEVRPLHVAPTTGLTISPPHHDTFIDHTRPPADFDRHQTPERYARATLGRANDVTVAYRGRRSNADIISVS